jgi:hypothetical protein
VSAVLRVWDKTSLPDDSLDFDSLGLADLESIIERGIGKFLSVGRALLSIKDRELYKQVPDEDYRDWDTYCRRRWGFARGYANYQIRAANLAPKLVTVRDHDSAYLTEWLIRPLVSLPEEKAIEVWDDAVRRAEEEGCRVTERHVRKARYEAFPPGTNIRTGERPDEFTPIIKPSDNWNFSPVIYDRIDGEDGHGYIPGDLYVNCFWYYARPGDVVADLMAGSGMAWHVYRDRERWIPPAESLDFADFHLFDLNPRGPYRERITRHDATEPPPVERINYAFADVPYFGMVKGQYGDSGPANLANQDLPAWVDSIRRMTTSLATRQCEGDRATVVTPNHADLKVVDDPYLMIDQMVIEAFRSAGYRLFHRVASSRRIQQDQSPNQARLNADAKRRRVLLTDMSYVLTFVREAEP